MYIGSTDYSKIYIGSSAVNKVYKGTTVVYSGYEAESLALFARMDVQPSDDLKNLINTTILAMKDAGVWTLHKRLYCRRMHTLQASLLDWKGVTDGVAYNSPIFRAGYGVKGDGISKHIREAWNPAATLTQGACTQWIEIVTLPTISGGVMSGCIQSSTERYFVDFITTTTNARFTLGGTVGPSQTGLVRGVIIGADRTSNTTSNIYVDGNKITSNSTSITLPNTNHVVLGRGTTGAPDTFSDVEIGWNGHADLMTVEQHIALYNIITNYNNGVVKLLYYPTYEYETVNLLERMDVLPDTSTMNLINTTIRDLKNAGIWTKLDVLYFRNVHTSQAACLNWVSRSYNSTLVNSPQFTPYLGITGNGSTSYINTNYRSINGLTKMQYNDISVGTSYTIYPGIGCHLLGFRQNGYFRITFQYNVATEEGLSVNSNTAISTTMNNNGDLIAVSRRSSDSYNEPYTNGIKGTEAYCLGDYAQGQNNSIFELCYRYIGNPTAHSDGTIGMSFYGSRLTETEQASMNTIWQNFYSNTSALITEGPEKVVNGGFDTSSDWTINTGWTISDSKVNYDDVTTNTYIAQTGYCAIKGDTQYHLKFTISGLTSGQAALLLTNHVGTLGFTEWGTTTKYFNNGDYDEIITSAFGAGAAGTRWRLYSYTLSGSPFSVDNISYKEIL